MTTATVMGGVTYTCVCVCVCERAVLNRRRGDNTRGVHAESLRGFFPESREKMMKYIHIYALAPRVSNKTRR